MARKKLAERLNGPDGEALKASRASGVVVKNLNKRRAFPVPWTPEEHQLFLSGVDKYGKGEWRKVAAEFVTTRTVQQVRDHAKGHFKKLGEKASGPNHWQHRWKPDEHERFMEGLRVLGKSNWTAIAKNYVRTKSPQQVTSHAVKHFKKTGEPFCDPKPPKEPKLKAPRQNPAQEMAVGGEPTIRTKLKDTVAWHAESLMTLTDTTQQ